MKQRNMIRANLLFFIGLLTMVYSDLWSQSSNDTQENAHRYAIGYTDTILYDNMYPYAEYGYEGPAPLFLQVWHPIAKSTIGLPCPCLPSRSPRFLR